MMAKMPAKGTIGAFKACEPRAAHVAPYHSAGCAASVLAIPLRRRIAACTTKVIKAPTVRQAAKNSIGAIVLPVRSRIQGTMFWAIKPPRLPTELIAARPAAAEPPVRKLEGRLHKTGWPEKIPAAAPHKRRNRAVLPGTYTLSTRHRAPNSAGPTINGVCLWYFVARAGTAQRQKATTTQGMMLIRPLTVLETPNSLTMVGSQ